MLNLSNRKYWKTWLWLIGNGREECHKVLGAVRWKPGHALQDPATLHMFAISPSSRGRLRKISSTFDEEVILSSFLFFLNARRLRDTVLASLCAHVSEQRGIWQQRSRVSHNSYAPRILWDSGVDCGASTCQRRGEMMRGGWTDGWGGGNDEIRYKLRIKQMKKRDEVWTDMCWAFFASTHWSIYSTIIK